MVSKSVYQALLQARRSLSKESKPVKIVRLTKAGVPSKMAEDTLHFDTMDQADTYMKRIAELNPTRSFKWQIVQ